MSVLARSTRRLAPTTLAVLALAFAACATAEDPNGSDEDVIPKAGSGGSGTSGTSGAATGGTAGTTPTGTAGKPAGTGGTVATTGGQTSTGGAPAGGMPATAGTTGTGGSAGTCPPYTGTLAKDSMIFMGGFGKSTTGTWSGYGYTYKYGTATISPGMGTSCFAGAKFCANGTVPADDKSGAGLGWNIGQAQGASTTTKVAITKPVKLTFAGVTAGMRVQLSASSTVSYCYTLTESDATAGTATIPLASFMTECWGTAGTAYDGVVPIEAIQIAVPGAMAAAKTFDLCVLDVEPG